MNLLWGDGCDFDSDGDSNAADARGWTELTVELRAPGELRVDIDPLEDAETLVLWKRSDHADLAQRAAEFLADRCGGTLSPIRPEVR